MSILDKAEIGSLVRVNLDLSKERLTKEIIDALKKKFPQIELHCTENDSYCEKILNERGYKNFKDLFSVCNNLKEFKELY